MLLFRRSDQEASKQASKMEIEEDRWSVAQDTEFKWWTKQNLKDTERELKSVFRYFFGLKFDAFADKTVLDVGAGPVGFVSFISGKKKIAIEPLKNRFEEIFELPKYVEYVATRSEDMALENDSIDVILCFNVLSHTQDPEKVLQEIDRVLKCDGGIFYFGMKFDSHDTLHPHIFSREEMKKLIEKYFVIDKVIDKYGLWGVICTQKK